MVSFRCHSPIHHYGAPITTNHGADGMNRGVNVGSKIALSQFYTMLSATKMCLEGLIDKMFSFGKAAEAFEYLAGGGHLGKVVIDLERD
jgi:hypothetical protein